MLSQESVDVAYNILKALVGVTNTVKPEHTKGNAFNVIDCTGKRAVSSLLPESLQSYVSWGTTHGGVYSTENTSIDILRVISIYTDTDMMEAEAGDKYRITSIVLGVDDNQFSTYKIKQS